ncbi:unnamed protein product [Ostreobium quekettii]|uniref:ATP-dependent Clp protease proteolytic subunit n=1 Tax=Ostreobium quekettii TaxID=121088 RepID=A0A8S1J9T3_9CHLO|nr:unnamed protein product [Ostreobium quekettii]|eukprot:evm.model.scf_125.4 EVM.evm.TU.scf_125.4   scf_125:46576-48901(-)
MGTRAPAAPTAPRRAATARSAPLLPKASIRRAWPRPRDGPGAQASMGVGIRPDDNDVASELKLVVPKSAYGLSQRQMAALGLVGEQVARRYDVCEDELTAAAHYGGEVVSEHTRIATRMAGGRPPSQAPPDLPSLLLDGRICYIGMPLVAQVTELVISELLWLNYNNPEQAVYVYINSVGSQTPDGQTVGFETEAYAILDTMAYIRPTKYTLVVGQAFGNAAMILASGKRGGRYALPHSRIMLAPPRANRSYGVASNVMIRANELENCTETYIDFLTGFTGRDKDEIKKDSGRNRYFTPEQAIEYGLIDKVVQPEDTMISEKDYDRMLAQSQAMQQRMAGSDAPAAAAG